MLPAFLGSDGSFPLQFALIFLVIFAVLAGTLLLIRRFTGRGLSSLTKSAQRQPRLGIVDVYELDRQRQLILLRRDNVEHLLLVGGPNDVVVERNISRGAGVRIPADEAAREEDVVEPVPELPPPSREPAFPLREPTFPPRETVPSFRQASAPDIAAERHGGNEPSAAEPVIAEPPFAMPVVVPPPVVETPAAAQPRADRSDEVAPVPPAPRREPQQPARSILRRTPPPLVNPKPDVASERSRAPEPQAGAPSPVPATAEPDFEAAFAAALAAPSATPSPMTTAAVRAPAAPPPAPERTGKVDAGMLSDMARQLEEALRRPASGATPPLTAIAATGAIDLARDPVPPDAPPAAAAIPEAPPPQPPETTLAEEAEEERPTVPVAPSLPKSDTDPMAAAMASAADAPPDGDDLFDEVARPAKPEPPAASETPPAPAEATKPPISASTNPFSVEEIEAEFARLLGRPLDRKN